MNDSNTPAVVGSSAELGPAAEAKRLVAHYQQNPQWFGGDEVDEVCRLIDAAVAAERERLKADAESWGNALNEAGWAATEAYRRHTGQVEPAIFFNHAKGILRDALAVYFKALRA